MTIQENSLRLNVGFIAHQSIGYSRAFPFDYPEIRIKPDLDLVNLSGVVTISRTSEGLLLQVTATAVTQATCGRCLEEFSQSLETDFTELYYFASQVKEDTELVFPETGIINLAPVLRDYLLLEMPINPLCQTACAGLCPVCGENLNAHPHDHEAEDIDPRLAALQALLDSDGSVTDTGDPAADGSVEA